MTPDVDAEPAPSLAARLGSAFLTLLLVLFVVAAVGRWRAPGLPDTAPELHFTDLEGARLSLSDLRGRPVLLNFWATWCLPCRAELPALKAWARLHPEVAVLGISVDRDPFALKAKLPSFGIPWRVFQDDGSAQAAFDVHILPTSILLDAEGRVLGAHSGIALGPDLEAILRGL